MRSVRVLVVCVWATLLVSAPWPSGLVRGQTDGGVAAVHGQTTHTSAAPMEGAAGASEGASRPAAEIPTILDQVEALERRCLDEINRLRAAHRLATLGLSQELRSVARSHSRRMAEGGFFSHTDLEGQSTLERVNGAGIKWKALAENIASSKGYVNPVAVCLHGWMNSADHRRNILSGDFNQTAVGVWISEDGTVYFTEIFVRR